MSNLQARQKKIQEKRKQTPFRDFVREIASWNAANFYKNSGLISIYPSEHRIKVLSHKDYQSYRESLVTMGNEDDIVEGDFFIRLSNLLKTVGLPSVMSFFQNENCDYVSPCVGSRNSYLSFGVIGGCENILYSYSIKDNSVDVLNSIMVRDNSSVVYSSVAVFRSYKVFNSKNIFDSNNIYASTNLQGCSFCIGCDNLVNVSYYINNVKVDKDYFDSYKSKNTFGLISGENLLLNLGTTHAKNSFLTINSQSVENTFFCYQLTNGRNAILSGSAVGNEEVYDVFFFGSPSGNRVYALNGGGTGIEDCYCSCLINGGSFVFYSIYLESCSFCLGCIGLRNKSYCILNKQYTKEDRYVKVGEIFNQMENDGQLGEFFPASMNPFCFNDTAAYLIDSSFTKEEVMKLGYLWRDEPIKVDIPEGVVTIKSEELSVFESLDEQGNRKLDETVCKRVVLDENGDAYRIIPMELEFLQKHGLPLPRKHWLTRMKENFRID